MFILYYVLFLPVLVFSASNPPTFKDVEVKGYSVYTLKFTKAIKNADTLHDELPKDRVFDHLEMKHQNIPVLKTNSIRDMDALDELTIEHSRVKQIQPGAFKNVPQLRKLSLKSNELEEISEGVFNNLQLSMLDLGKNKITRIEAKALNNMPNLLNIHLADNLIETWDNRWFENDPLLTRISMQNNLIEKLPADSFKNLNGDKRFGTVDLKINLIFSNNKINAIDDNAFQGLENINNLWLDNNRLTGFSENLLQHVEVQDLRIEHNQIKCLEGDLSMIIKASGITHMDGNPFDCTCLENIKKWIKDNNKVADVFYSDLNCEADRLRRKMTDLERRLTELNSDRDDHHVKEVENITPKGMEENDVEILFK